MSVRLYLTFDEDDVPQHVLHLRELVAMTNYGLDALSEALGGTRIDTGAAGQIAAGAEFRVAGLEDDVLSVAYAAPREAVTS
jgi:hypothetical protein